MYEDYYLGHPAEIIWSDSQVLLVWMDDDVTWVSRPLKIVLVGAGARLQVIGSLGDTYGT